MRLTAKRVVLELLTVAGGRAAPVAVLVDACALFGITENSTRVTLARLLATGTLEASARGSYRLGAGSEELTKQLTSWRDLEKQVRRWDGSWICVHAAELARSDRAVLRRRERALRLLGFRELARGLEVRPGNLDGGVDAVRDRLHALGLEKSALVFCGVGFDVALESRARKLWETRALNATYKRTTERLDAWMEREPTLTRETAARESFLIGGEALRQILFDPRLPEPLVDVAARRALVDAARRYDTHGRKIWESMFGLPHGLGAATEGAHERRTA
jgi:phenylacetic acid degradation operon negative regulatory protein